MENPFVDGGIQWEGACDNGDAQWARKETWFAQDFCAHARTRRAQISSGMFRDKKGAAAPAGGGCARGSPLAAEQAARSIAGAVANNGSPLGGVCRAEATRETTVVTADR
jgi:hypothetical protein